MPMDGAMLVALTGEIRETLTGARVDKIYQPGDHDLLIRLRTRTENINLYLSAHPVRGGICMTRNAFTAPQPPPLLTMVMRKHLSGGRLVAVRQDGLDRTIFLDFLATSEIGDPVRRTLILEVMGRHSNIILLDGDKNTVIDALVRFNHLVSRHREILPGRIYASPPPRQGLRFLDPLPEILPLPENEEGSLAEHFSRIFPGLGSKTLQELLKPAGQDPDRVRILLEDFRSRLLNSSHQPCMTLNPPVPADIFLFPVDSPHIRQFTSVSDMVSTYYQMLGESDRFHSEQRKLQRSLRQMIARREKKMEIHEENLREAEKADVWRIRGELLTANLHRIRPGMDSITLDNYYLDPPEPLTLELDPALSPSANANRCFRRVSKVREAAKVSRQILEQLREDLTYLETVEVSLKQAETTGDLMEILEELTRSGFLGRPPGRQQKPVTPNGPMRFISTTGMEILVGRNNRQNDWLTMKQAADTDVWLHTKEIPGSHVILKTRDGTYDETSLLEAATLAAWFSKARDSVKVPVDYTPRKHLRKPGGSRPGMVVYDRNRTILVDPDPALAENLRNHS